MSLVFFLGFSAMITQVLMLRELMVQFAGNELAVSIILGSWLFWTAAGNFYTSLWQKEDNIDHDALINVFLWALVVLLPSQVYAARLIRPLWHTLPGEIFGVGKILLTSFLILAPGCLILGSLFVLYIGKHLKLRQAQVTGSIYIVEAVGASIGGLFFTFVLISWFSDLQIALGVGLLNLILAVWLSRQKPLLLGIGLCVTIFVGLIMGIYHSSNPNPDWSGYQVLEQKDTVYGRLVVASRVNDELSFFSDRHHLQSIPDKLNAEESIHWAGLQNPNFQTALLIGGIGESVGEILKYPDITEVSLIELDAGLIDLVKRHFPPYVLSYISNPKIKVINSDGRYFLKNSQKHYDLLLLNLPDPSTANLNRFYTIEFFREVKNSLTQNGIFSFSVNGAQNFYRETQLNFLKGLQKSLFEVFSQVEVIPGESVIFLATNSQTPLIADSDSYLSRLKKSGITTSYVSEAYLPARLETSRLDSFKKQLANTDNYLLNYDFHPMSYYYNLILWSDYFNETWGKVLNDFIGINPLWFWLFIIIFLATIILIRKLGLLPKSFSPGVTIFTAGMAEISTVLLIIMSFQIFFGNIYQKIGLILACFMIGLAMGGYLIIKLNPRIKQKAVYLSIQGIITIYPLIVIGSLIWGTKIDTDMMKIILPVLTLGLGILGGVQFPLAVEIIKKEHQNERVIGGVLNGVDLLGATTGALLILSFFVPVIGIYGTLLFLSGLNLAGFIFLL